MIRDNDIFISVDAKIIDGLKLLNERQKKILICINNDKTLAGVVADGDIRRALVKGSMPGSSIKKALNKNAFFLNDQISFIEAQTFLSNTKSIIPVVDCTHKVVGYYQYKEYKDINLIKNKKVAVLGLGYVGLTLALSLAENGFTVHGFDINQSLLDKLRNKQPPFFEKGLDALLDKHVGNNFKLYSNIESAKADIYVITVGTPIIGQNKVPNIRYIEDAAGSIAKVLEPGDLVVLRSTVSIFCSREIVLPALEKGSGLKCGSDFYISFAPERTAEGVALKELRYNPQLIGAYDAQSYDLTARLFNELTPTLINVGSLEAAELCKLMDNTFRDHIFAYSNLIAQLAENIDLNIHSLIDAVNFGYNRNNIPKPSPGVGGPCLSKDPYILNQAFDRLGHRSNLLLETRRINESGPSLIKSKLEALLNVAGKSLKTCKKISLIGMAFKGFPETSDLRDSTAVWFLECLPDRSVIHTYDPVVPESDLRSLGITPTSLDDAFANADAVVILNNHKSYSSWNITRLVSSMNKPAVVIDTWYNFNPVTFKTFEGILYGGVGND